MTLLLSLIFLLLAVALAVFLGFQPLRVVRQIELKTTRNDAEKEEKRLLMRVGLSKKDLFVIKLRTTLQAAGVSELKFGLMTAGAGAIGLIGGGLLFSWAVGVFAGLTCAVFPYIFLTLRVQKLERKQEEELGSIMQSITNTYVSCNDLRSTVQAYISDRNQRQGRPLIDPFGEFLAELSLVNADQTRALIILQRKISNPHFHDWCKMLILCGRDSEMKFALYPILASMNDKKALQEESDNAMKKIWINFLTVVGLSFSIPLMLKLLNEDWYEILVGTLIGQAILIVMFIYALVAAFLVLRINKPLSR